MVDGLTINQRVFLAAYEVCLNISKSAAAANVSCTSHYGWLSKSETYRKRFVEVHEACGEVLEAEAVRRAVEGEKKLVTYKGEPVYVWVDEDGEVVEPNSKKAFKRVPLFNREKSDTLLLALLKAKKPDAYKDRSASELSGPNGGPIQSESLITAGELLKHDPSYARFIDQQSLVANAVAVCNQGEQGQMETGETSGCGQRGSD